VAQQLSLVSPDPDPALTARLSALLGQPVGAVGRASGQPAGRRLARGVRVDFPVAVYRAWRWWAAVRWPASVCQRRSCSTCGPSAAAVPGVVLRAGPSARRHDFADYYREHPARSFAAQVWTNNALVAALAMFSA